jgi:hypothetical protein
MAFPQPYPEPGYVLLSNGKAAPVVHVNNLVEVETLLQSVVDDLKPPSSIGDGVKNVAVAGTAEPLASSTPCKKVIITAKETNSDVICVGGSEVIALAGTRTGSPLEANESVVVEIDDLNKIYINSVVSGEGATYTFVS